MPGCASMGDAPWRDETLWATVRGNGGRVTRWWVQLRALVAIGLLVLFAGMSIVLACAFAVLAFWLQGNSPVSWAWLRYLSAAAALLFLVCTIPVRALRRGGKDPGGIPVSKSEAPELWALVHAIADATRTRPPDEIRLVAEPNAFAAEGGRLLGLRARKRYLLLGAPVVAALTDRQLDAVISHEFGHYSDQDTRINPMVYRIRSTIGGVINELGPVSMEKGLLRGYLRWFEIVASGILERQEILADRFSVRTTDLRTAATALEMVDSASLARERFRTDYLDSARRYGGFAGFVDAFGHFFNELWLTLPESERHPEPADATAPAWSTHPPLRQRIDALSRGAGGTERLPRDPSRSAPPKVGPGGRRLPERAAQRGPRGDRPGGGPALGPRDGMIPRPAGRPRPRPCGDCGTARQPAPRPQV